MPKIREIDRITIRQGPRARGGKHRPSIKSPFTRIFIPNRGEIACRLIDACKNLSLTPILGFSIADSASRATRLAPESVCIGASDARDSYLNCDKVLAAACEARADAIHPGYGFLSENAEFARNVSRLGMRFIGPSAVAMKKLGDKVEAKQLARRCHIPLLDDISFTETELRSPELPRNLNRYLKSVSFPLLVKAAGGGGGRGMRIVEHRSQLEEQMRSASREAKNLFNDATIFIEPYIIGARHVEVQVVADSSGDTRALGTRDCSLQRRHQKIIEEAPASQLSASSTKKLTTAAEKICKAAGYESLATVEFLLTDKGKFYFLEVNTRLQVEHPVTELSTGLDLVGLQLRIAQGELLSQLLPLRLGKTEFAIEARICAEAPELDFRSSTGPLVEASFPELTDVRVDCGFEAGDRISHHYDSLIAKVIARGKTRAEAVKRLQRALGNTVLSPCRTNLGYLQALLASKEFQKNQHTLLSAGEVLNEFNHGYQSRLVMALLAAAFFKCLSGGDTAWTAVGSWTNTGLVQSTVDICVNGNFFQIPLSREADRWSAAIYQDQECLLVRSEIEFSYTENGAWTLTLNGNTTSGTLTAPGPSQATVACQGDLFSVGYLSPRIRFSSAAVAAAGRAEIRAHLPGKIVSISTTIGKLVHESTPLLVLESMKMEHLLNAPVTGTVQEILVAPGQSVAAGALLAVIVAA